MKLKTILLMRHAEAVPYETAPDFDRDLTAKGRAQATQIGMQLAERHFKPDLVLCSTANRTKQTLEQVMKGAQVSALDWKTDFRDELYNASMMTILGLVDELPDDVRTIMIVAHNPGISNTLWQLSSISYPGFNVAEAACLQWATLDANEPWVSAVSAMPKLMFRLAPAADFA